MPKFRMTIQLNIDSLVEGESAEKVVRQLFDGVTSVLVSMNASGGGAHDPGLMTMAGEVNPAPEGAGGKPLN